MTSVAAGDPAFADLTARARIRDAAIRLFTENGVAGTSILDIARAAGVSGGLIRHHFGSKDGLRTACDTYVLDELLHFKELVLDQSRADPGFAPAFDTRQVLLRRYLGRAMIDGSAAAAAKFTEIVDLTERWLVDQATLALADPRACAAVLAAMQIGVMVMADHVGGALGEDPLSPQAQLRIALASADIYAHPLASPAVVERARQLFGRSPPAPSEQSAPDG